jgi:hypothetical protein
MDNPRASLEYSPEAALDNDFPSFFFVWTYEWNIVFFQILTILLFTIILFSVFNILCS